MTDVHVAGAELAALGVAARLELWHAAPIEIARVPEILGSQAAPWLGERAPDRTPGFRSFLCDLELHAGGSGHALFRKAAEVSLGDPRPGGDGWVVPVEWRATTLTPLFPVLAGHIHIGRGGIGLDGRYAPPGGRLGYVLDAALLGAAARQTGRWFLRKLAAQLT